MLGLILAFMFYAALIFSGAGTFYWIEGWIFLLSIIWMWTQIFFRLEGESLLIQPLKKVTLSLSKQHFSSIYFFFFCVSFWMFINGVDTARYQLSDVTRAQQYLGGALFFLSLLLLYWSARVNLIGKFSKRKRKMDQVRIKEFGPYRLIRHPMYFASCLMLPSASLMMASILGLLTSLFLISCLFFYTYREDKLLKEEFKQYQAYSEQVRYRLLPYIW